MDAQTTAVWIAAVIAVWGVVTQRVLARRRASVDHIFNILNDHDFIKARTKFLELAKSEAGLLPYADKDHPDQDGAGAITLVLNNYELMAIGIQRGILDYKLIERYARAIIIGHWDVAGPYITQLRIVRNNPKYYTELETMKNWMAKTAKPNGRFWSLFF